MTGSVQTLGWLDLAPRVSVAEAEYKRLLGFPVEHALEGRALELAKWARGGDAENGRPWVMARGVTPIKVNGDGLWVDGTEFSSKRLREHLSEAEARHAALVAVSAGPECEAHARRLWEQEKPDEYFFLEVFGSAVVEELLRTAGARLCAWADAQGMAALPHYSPGYPGWEISDQGKLLSLARNGRGLPSDLEALDTGMLRPKKSLLALFGLTNRLDLARSLSTLIPCENCSYASCQFRRAPFQRAAPLLEDVARLQPRAGLDQNAKYSVHPRALRKWAGQRLELRELGIEGVEAVFHYEGTTCSNMGRPLRYDYTVKLGGARQGYPILEVACGAAAGDMGYTFQCEHIVRAAELSRAVATEKPLLHQPLSAALSWARANNPAGCFCNAASRAHKWGIVFEVIHYALAQREKTGVSK